MAVTLTTNSLITPGGTLIGTIAQGLRVLGSFEYQIIPGQNVVSDYDTGIRLSTIEGDALVGERLGVRSLARYIDLGFFYRFNNVTGGSAATQSGKFGMYLGSSKGIWVRGWWPANPTYDGTYIFMDLSFFNESTVPAPTTVTITVTHINSSM